jgi:hypothetical protein
LGLEGEKCSVLKEKRKELVLGPSKEKSPSAVQMVEPAGLGTDHAGPEIVTETGLAATERGLAGPDTRGEQVVWADAPARWP